MHANLAHDFYQLQNKQATGHVGDRRDDKARFCLKAIKSRSVQLDLNCVSLKTSFHGQ